MVSTVIFIKKLRTSKILLFNVPRWWQSALMENWWHLEEMTDTSGRFIIIFCLLTLYELESNHWVGFLILNLQMYLTWDLTTWALAQIFELIVGKLKMLICENVGFRQEINADQRHGSFSAHFQLVLDRTKQKRSFWRRIWKLLRQTVFS